MSQLSVFPHFRPKTILCGMGELHIEIIHDRIRREYGIETHLGPLQVAYRETILHEASTTGKIICALGYGWRRDNYYQLHTIVWFSCFACDVDTLDRTVGDRKNVVTVELTVRPLEDIFTCGSYELAFKEEVDRQLSAEMKEAVKNGVYSAYLQGNIELNSFLLS